MRICLLSSKRLFRGYLLLLFLAVVSTLLPRTAAADEFLERYSRGINLYKAEKYVEAISEFEAAYAHKQLPRTLFNIARSYLKLGKAQEALTYFKRYKDLEPSPPQSIQNLVSEGVEQAQKMIEALKPAAQPPPEPTQPVAQPGTPETKGAEAEPEPAPLAAPPPAPKLNVPPPRAPRPIWRLAVGGVGIGIGAGLIGLGASALAVDGQCIGTPPPLQPCKLDFDTIGIGAGLTVSGVVLLGAGVVLLAIPGRRERPLLPTTAAR